MKPDKKKPSATALPAPAQPSNGATAAAAPRPGSGTHSGAFGFGSEFPGGATEANTRAMDVAGAIVADLINETEPSPGSSLLPGMGPMLNSTRLLGDVKSRLSKEGSKKEPISSFDKNESERQRRLSAGKSLADAHAADHDRDTHAVQVAAADDADSGDTETATEDDEEKAIQEKKEKIEDEDSTPTPSQLSLHQEIPGRAVANDEEVQGKRQRNVVNPRDRKVQQRTAGDGSNRGAVIGKSGKKDGDVEKEKEEKEEEDKVDEAVASGSGGVTPVFLAATEVQVGPANDDDDDDEMAAEVGVDAEEEITEEIDLAGEESTEAEESGDEKESEEFDSGMEIGGMDEIESETEDESESESGGDDVAPAVRAAAKPTAPVPLAASPKATVPSPEVPPSGEEERRNGSVEEAAPRGRNRKQRGPSRAPFSQPAFLEELQPAAQQAQQAGTVGARTSRRFRAKAAEEIPEAPIELVARNTKGAGTSKAGKAAADARAKPESSRPARKDKASAAPPTKQHKGRGPQSGKRARMAVASSEEEEEEELMAEPGVVPPEVEIEEEVAKPSDKQPITKTATVRKGAAKKPAAKSAMEQAKLLTEVPGAADSGGGRATRRAVKKRKTSEEPLPQEEIVANAENGGASDEKLPRPQGRGRPKKARIESEGKHLQKDLEVEQEEPKKQIKAAAKQASKAKAGPGKGAALAPATTAPAAAAAGPSKVPSKPAALSAHIALSGMHTPQQKELCEKLSKLKNIEITSGSNSHDWQPDFTHVIAPAVLRNQKCLAALAAGVWLVSPAFATACFKAKKLVDEEPYEVTAPGAGGLVESGVARFWRLRRETTGNGAFSGLAFALARQLDDPPSREDLCGIIRAGEGTVVPLHKQADVVVAAASIVSNNAAVQRQIKEGALCVSSGYITDWVARPGLNLECHVLAEGPSGRRAALAHAEAERGGTHRAEPESSISL